MQPAPNKEANDSQDRLTDLKQGQKQTLESSPLDIQEQINRLEEMLLKNSEIPLSRRTLVDEEQLLQQLDLVRLSLPQALHKAEEIIRRNEEIILQAEQYAQELIEAAEQRAAQTLNEMGIIRQAEIEAQQMRRQVEQEAEGDTETQGKRI